MSWIIKMIMLNMLIVLSCENNGTNEDFYDKHFAIKNSITGTGNKTLDGSYMEKCNSLNCLHCCVGEIEEMQCGKFEKCEKYKIYLIRSRIMGIVLGVIFPYLLIPILWILLYKTNKEQKPRAHCILSKVMVIYTGILLPPYGFMKLLELKWPQLGKLNQNNLGENNLIKNNLNEQNKKKLFQEKEFFSQNFGLGKMCINSQESEDEKEIKIENEMANIKENIDNYGYDIQVEDRDFNRAEFTIDIEGLNDFTVE